MAPSYLEFSFRSNSSDPVCRTSIGLNFLSPSKPPPGLSPPLAAAKGDKGLGEPDLGEQRGEPLGEPLGEYLGDVDKPPAVKEDRLSRPYPVGDILGLGRVLLGIVVAPVVVDEEVVEEEPGSPGLSGGTPYLKRSLSTSTASQSMAM